MTMVKCSVSNCTYWDEGNNCGADAIMIDVDKHATAKYDTEIAGEEVELRHKDAAVTSAGTCCHTFKPKGK